MKRKLKRHKRQGVKLLAEILEGLQKSDENLARIRAKHDKALNKVIDDEIKARDKRSNQLLEKLAIDNEVRIIFDYFVIVSIDRIS